MGGERGGGKRSWSKSLPPVSPWSAYFLLLLRKEFCSDIFAISKLLVGNSPAGPPNNVVYAEPERVHQLLLGRLVIARVIKASRGQIQDGLLHDNGEEAIVVVPCQGCRPPPYAALDAMMGGGYCTLSVVSNSTTISIIPPPPRNDNNGVPFPLRHRRGELTRANPPMQ